MAHKGRLYPLSVYRPWNADAGYPFWLAHAYDLHMPFCTGTAFDFLNNIRMNNMQGVNHPSGIVFSGSFSESFPEIRDYFFDARIGWLNLDTDARVVEITLTTTLHPIGFPPITQRFGYFNGTFSNVQPLDLIEDTWTAVDDPTFWNPLGGWKLTARPY